MLALPARLHEKFSTGNYCETTGGIIQHGRFGAVDAMYAPVVARLHTYAVDVTPVSRAYMDAVMALPAWIEWRDAGVKEPWVLADDEVDWPTVRKA